MAWTTPTTRATGDLITAAIWNADLVDNLSYLHARLPTIATTELSAAASTIDFQSIPSTFRHLLLTGALRTDLAGTTDTVLLRINNDSGANYDYLHAGIAHSASVVTAEGLAATSARIVAAPGATAPANTFNAFEVVLPDYLEATQLHAWSFRGGLLVAATTGNIAVQQGTGRFRTAGAITRLTLLPGTGTNFAAGSYVSLQGIGHAA